MNPVNNAHPFIKHAKPDTIHNPTNFDKIFTDFDESRHRQSAAK